MTRCQKKRPIGGARSRRKEEARICLYVSRRELATILAALRFHQDENLQGTSGIPDTVVRKIATGGGVRPLSFEEVSNLSKRLKAARRARQPGYRRSWRCPACGRFIDCSYEDLAEAGIPICTDCDVGMELQ